MIKNSAKKSAAPFPEAKPDADVAKQRPSLKLLAEYLDLSPSTISFVLNDSPGRSIPEATRERVRAAALKFNYQPSMIARKLQGQRTKTVGILLPELGSNYHSEVICGAAELLMREEYLYFTMHHRHRPDLVRTYPESMQARGVEGILAIDTHLESANYLPTVLISGRTDLPGVSNVALNSRLGAELALGHLHQLGHREIAFMRGQLLSSDTEARWAATLAVARQLELPVRESLTICLEQASNSPEVGYLGIKRILADAHPFTAVVCFNDVSAIGVIRALHDSGLRVPGDVSVVGYDDIPSATYHVPSITTLRQPLQKMGSIAVGLLLKKLDGQQAEALVEVEPELVIRESTGKARRQSNAGLTPRKR